MLAGIAGVASFPRVRSSPLRHPVLRESRRALAATGGPVVLAVSGGCDSMALLYAAVAARRDRVAAVATFDHGTGAAARRAVALVRAECAALGVPLAVGGGMPVGRTESAWREARWAFLRGVAAAHGARVATAHTRDDHVETVLMRVLRGSGARGLAGLHAESAVLRPFLALDRGTVRAFVVAQGIAFTDDPTNDSRRFLRNRIRLDLLPALRRVAPDIDARLLAVSLRAAEVRGRLDALAAEVSTVNGDGRLDVAASGVAGYSRESLAALWPALAARVGVALDRRGTERLASFTINGRVGGRVQVSGGWELDRQRDRFVLQRMVQAAPGECALAPGGEVRFEAWRFTPAPDRVDDPWAAVLAADATSVVRRWRAGDRMVAAGSTKPRRVKRFLSDARVTGARRARWPVVVSNGEVVWIPGVRRSSAATARPGRSEVSYMCDVDDRA